MIPGLQTAAFTTLEIQNQSTAESMSPPTPEACATAAALREIEFRTRPAGLKRHGYEMDRMNKGGLAAIRDALVAQQV